MTVLAQWALTSDTLLATTEAADVTAGDITNGSLTAMVPEGNLLSTYSASGATSAATAVANNSYFYITLTADSGKRLNLTSLTFKIAKGGSSGTRGGVVRSSVDSYVDSLYSEDVTTVWPNFADITVDLTGANYQNLSEITFRLYTYTPSTDTSMEWDDVTINGTVVPEAGTFWITPVTNRTVGAEYASMDLNRIGNNLQYLSGLLNGYGYTVSITGKADWTINDIPRAADMVTLINDLTAIRAALTVFLTTPATPANMNNVTYSIANNIEKILYDVDTLISNMVAAWYYSGDLYCGEV